MNPENKKLFTAVSVLVGTCIGAGVLGIPYVAAQSGFFVAFAYLIFIGLLILTVNLYFGEVILRTKGDHQIPGYAEKYLGKKGKFLAEFATVFGIYSAIVAYMIGMGGSLSFIFFNHLDYTIYFGIGTGLLMSILLWGGLKSLKKYEKIGVSIVLVLILAIFSVFINKINLANLYTFNSSNIFLPFGVILFALLSFHALPELQIILKKKEKLLKKTLLIGTLISVIFYSLFTFIVVGYKGIETPQIATLALGAIFIILGMFTMFTSYLALGNALQDNLKLDRKFKKRNSWFVTAIIPIFLFLIIQLTDFFSFVKVLGIGGVISGGLTGILILLMVKKAKEHGNRKPEYQIPLNSILIWILILIFATGIIAELFF